MRTPGKACLALACALILPALAAQRGADAFVTGRDLYLFARRDDGSALAATVQSDIRLHAAAAACVNCHRRSGLGSVEGTVRALPVTGPVLFTPTATRPAYDAASLLRALTDGIAAGGRPLDAVMPRYELGDADAAALLAYLRRLGADAAPGVTAEEIELATIVGEDAPPAQSEALLAVLGRYVALKNSGTRREDQRAAASSRHPFGERRDRAFRRWRLAVWTLRGPASTWEAQLRGYYARRPPFAVLSGVTGHDWPVVHDFCERQRMPCVLPIVDVPGDATTGTYSLYYSLGASLEGGIAARDVVATAPTETRVLVVRGRDERARAASSAFQAAMGVRAITVREQPSPPAAGMSRDDWHGLLARERPDILVAWVDGKSLAALAGAASRETPLPDRIYTAESIASWREIAALAALRARVRHVYPWQPPAAGRSQFPREQAWLRAQHLDALDTVSAARALFACHAVGEGLASIESSFSRDYLLEQFEHMLDRTGMTSLVPATHLGPDQRILSNGAYVMRLGTAPDNPLIAGEWRTL